MNRNVNSNGFTLIELLVVIVVIAILASILFPVFASAKLQANQTTCASNLKQFGCAFAAYEADWGALSLPGGFNNSTTNEPIIGWLYSAGAGESQQIGALWPYIKARINSNARGCVWSCPMTAPVEKGML